MNGFSVKKLEVSLALLLAFVPLILRIITGYWDKSVSDYAYSNANNVLCCLLTISSVLFVYNSAYNNKHWYNTILGLSLLGVALFPNRDFPIIHYVFASIFFVGSIATTSLSSSIFLKNTKYVLSAIISIALILHFIFNLFSLLVAEWIGIIPISFHFIVKSLKN